MLYVCPVVQETHMDEELSIEGHLVDHQKTVVYNAFVELCCLDIIVCVTIFSNMSEIERDILM